MEDNRLNDELVSLNGDVQIKFEEVEGAGESEDDGRFEDDLLGLLEAYNTNLVDMDLTTTTSHDKDYEEAISAVNQKRDEIAIKESNHQSTESDRVELKSLEAGLNKACKLREKERDNRRRELAEEEDHRMFLSQGGEDDYELEITPAPSRRAAMNHEAFAPMNISDDDENEDGYVSDGVNAEFGKVSKCTPKTRKNTTGQNQSRIQKRGKTASRKRGGGRQGPSMLNIGSLLRDDIVANAAANQGAGKQASFAGLRSRKDALAALIASVPSSQRDLNRGEKSALDKAARQFVHKGQGSMQVKDDGWRLKGMSTSLESFQMLGAAWACERELGDDAPYGGILADTMGFGKTVQMIAVMVENQPKPSARNKTTLIVVPGNIVDQWVREIAKHTNNGIMEDILVHRSGSRIGALDVPHAMRRCQVIVTTYHEVMANYPKCVLPAHLVTDKAKDDWWANYYEENKGPLLRVPFHRIILDEAQHMRNHESRTSKACRLLTAKYKWVLSGTPLSNCMEEMFSYFNFLGVPGAGNFAQFKQNYGKRNDTTDQRLFAILSMIMIRRTGADRLLGKPLVALPAIDHQDVKIEFDPIERAIYMVVRQRFITRINDWSASRGINQMSKNLFTMLTRLRQMCAHVCMVAVVVRDLLEVEDIEKIWSTIEKHSRDGNEINRTTAKVLRTILQQAQDERTVSTTSGQQSDGSTKQNETVDLTINENSLDSGGAFEHLRQGGVWDQIRSRSLCHCCKRVPENDCKLAVPCGHLYCADCLGTLLSSAKDAGMNATCSECQSEIYDSANMKAIVHIARGSGRGSMPAAQTSEDTRSKKSKSIDTAWLEVTGVELLSTKVQAIVSTVEGWISSDPKAKVIIFTLWIPIIRILSKICARKGWGFQKYTGACSAGVRDKALRRFQNEEGDQILLMSMRAGGLGLNLVQSNYAIIADPWWNEATEAQAYSRIYRIGQQRDCVVRRFVVKDAIDTQLMLHLQQKKTEECNRIINGRGQKDPSIQDLMKLFGPVRRDPRTNAMIVGDGKDEIDGLDEFVTSEDVQIVEDSDTEEVCAAPPRPEE